VGLLARGAAAWVGGEARVTAVVGPQRRQVWPNTRELVQAGHANHPQGHWGGPAHHDRSSVAAAAAGVRQKGDKSRTDERDAAKVDVDDARLVADELASRETEFSGVREVDISTDLHEVDGAVWRPRDGQFHVVRRVGVHAVPTLRRQGITGLRGGQPGLAGYLNPTPGNINLGAGGGSWVAVTTPARRAWPWPIRWAIVRARVITVRWPSTPRTLLGSSGEQKTSWPG
jgi:hypothetical protein